MTATQRWGRVFLVAAALATTGCAQAGALGDILGGGSPQGERLLQGDVTVVDANRQFLQVRATNGQTANVRFDSRTQVVYQQRTYPVTALEPGDQISMRLAETQQGELYTDQILVTRSIQEIRGTTTAGPARQYMQVEGYVGQVDTQRGLFELRSQGGGTLVVSLPYNTSAANVSRFQQLRSNQFVRVGGYLIANDRLELADFR
jgi:hypothetical protein